MQSSPIRGLPTPISVVAHDAGAANQIFSWLLADLDYFLETDGRLYLTGPAYDLWDAETKTPTLTQSSLECILDGASSLLSGTSGTSNTEHHARQVAKQSAIKSVAVIDHWVNYESRFIRSDGSSHPDEIWVSDEYALYIAEHTFKNMKVTLVRDYYMENQLEKIGKYEDRKQYILYLSEPINSRWGRQDTGNMQALRYFLSIYDQSKMKDRYQIELRMHPSEKGDIYQSIIDHRPDIQIERKRHLHESIEGAVSVVGCESYALVVALRAGRPVYCSLPPWAPRSRLPFPTILPIDSLLNDGIL